ncbi:hypothetical protein [Inquilinus sp. CAU 1745]
MATDGKRLGEDEMLEARQAFWSGFLKFSTYSIVGVSLLLIIMALFLL